MSQNSSFESRSEREEGLRIPALRESATLIPEGLLAYRRIYNPTRPHS